MEEELDQWDAQNAQPYDSARKGGSCPFAALRRNAHAQVAHILGETAVGLFADLKIFSILSAP